MGNLSAEQRASLDVFASDIGLVFQIRDDLLEVEQDTATLGKNAGSDAGNDKSTYPSTLGIEGARRRAEETHAARRRRAAHAGAARGRPLVAVGVHPEPLALSDGASQ